MGFGSPKPPKPTPTPQVPQEDDPQSYEAQRRFAMDLQGQEGRQAHLLAGNSSDPLTDNRKRLLGVSQSPRLLA